MEGKLHRFVGVDLGKRSMSVHLIQANESHESWSCLTDAEGRARLLKRLKPSDVIAMEACPLAFILEAMIRKTLGATVYVLNPHGLAMIYRSTKKTDREDAAKLAWIVQRLPEAELPVVTVPTEQEQELRLLTTEQVSLTQDRTRVVNRLHALFVQEGITTVKKKDVRRSEHRVGLYGQLSPLAQARAQRYERVLQSFEENLEELETAIRKIVSKHELTPYLMSIPGVGPNLVAAYLGYLGNGERFKRTTVTAYAGLVPKVDCSGDKNKYGNITKRGCTALRRALVQGAWGLVRSTNGGVLQKRYERLVESKGKSKALVAVARKLIETMWIVATRKTMYFDCDMIKYRQKLARYEIVCGGVAGAA